MLYQKYMQMAIEKARLGAGWASPNPLVGAVIVKNGQVISTGYHQRYGGPHAERNAINACKESMTGATLYVTMEPCCNYGHTPPCTELIIESGIKTVICGSIDPHPENNGKGIATLRAAGLTVIPDVMKQECDDLNAIYFHYCKTQLPYVMVRYSMTADGKIATRTGVAQWISSSASRNHVQKYRNRYAAIMVGVGTVIADDLMMTCTIPGSRQPIRIICDTTLRTPLGAKLVLTAKEYPTLIATCCEDEASWQPYLTNGCEIMPVARHNDHVDLPDLMQKLGARGIDSVILEGGSELTSSALEVGVVQKVQAYISPKIFGGATAKTPMGGLGVARVEDAYRLGEPKVTIINGIDGEGNDVLLEWKVLSADQAASENAESK